MTNDSTTKTPKLGEAVTYRDSRGKQKAAFVIGTRKSVEKGHSIERPEKGRVNLAIFSPSGSMYVRANVPAFDGESVPSYEVV